MLCGILIVIAGVVLLGQTMGLIPYDVWSYLVPVLLILWGAGIIAGRSWSWCVPRESRYQEGGRRLDGPL